MDQRLTGACQCRDVRYSIAGDPVRLNVCHCRDCQRQSGSAFGMSLVIAPESFRLESGSLKQFVTTSDSGRQKTCAFCPHCGVRIYNATSALMSVKAGTLDDTSLLDPDAHYWVSRKQAWLEVPEGAECFDTA